jgi:DNA-binding transcriptional ArsR family regulator
MSGPEPTLRVAVSYGDLKAEFTGRPDDVIASVNSFLAKSIPTMELAQRVYVSYSARELVEMFGDYVKITPEGPRIWLEERQQLSDKNLIALQLVATKMAHQLGKYPDPSMTTGELQFATGLKGKAVSSRLSELVKAGYVNREKEGKEGARYTITTQGVHWLKQELERKVGH